MSLVLTAAPAVEPVTLAEVKAHARIDSSAEDQFISSLIVTSRLQIEQALGLAMVTQDWVWTLDAWPRTGNVVFPIRPISSVATVKVRDADGSPHTLQASSYTLDGLATPPRLIPTGAAFPEPGVRALGIEIAFTAGFGADGDAVPAPIRHALLLLISHWFESREPMPAGSGAGHSARIPQPVSDLLMPYQLVRL